MPERTVQPASAGLYVHVPFCRRKCPYCSFYSFAPQSGDIARYLKAVQAHLASLAQEPLLQGLQFDTVFFGGGTPSVLPPALLGQILKSCLSALSCSSEAEISIEVNPGTVQADDLLALRRAGFNRLSFGVQSFHDHELRRLGRIHTALEAEEAVLAARHAGFTSISLDLMYGLPGQSPADWQSSLEKALSLAPEHLSLYELTPETPSPLYDQIQQGTTFLPSEEEVLAMMDCTASLISTSPLKRYEISNYARDGHSCRHNINYWQNGSYLGLGPGAVSALGGRRFTIPPGIADYHDRAANGENVWLEEERLSVEESFRETVIMGLRMLKGVSARRLKERYQLDLACHYGPVLDQLLRQGLLAWRGQNLALTERGLPLANQVMAALV